MVCLSITAIHDTFTKNKTNSVAQNINKGKKKREKETPSYITQRNAEKQKTKRLDGRERYQRMTDCTVHDRLYLLLK